MKRSIVLPGYRIVSIALFLCSIMVLSSFSQVNSDISYDQSRKNSICKRESMISILEALEDGREYNRPEEWTGSNYFDIVDFEIDDERLEIFLERLEEFSIDIEKRIEKVLNQLDSSFKEIKHPVYL